MPAGGDVGLAALLVGRHEHVGGDLGHAGGVVDDAGVGVALDVVDVGLVDRPGVDLALGAVVGVVDRAVVEAEDLGGPVEVAAVEPRLLGGLEGVLGGVGDEGVEGRLQRLGRRRRRRCRWRRRGRRRWWPPSRAASSLSRRAAARSWWSVSASSSVVVGAGRAEQRAGQQRRPTSRRGSRWRHVGSPAEGPVTR